jgi:hypothetical protein
MPACLQKQWLKHPLFILASATMNSDLPNHVVSNILIDADLCIDTRRALMMRPGPATRFISADARSTLASMFEVRSRAWTRYVQLKNAGGNTTSALGGAIGPHVQLSPRESLTISLDVWDVDGRVLMHFEKLLLVEARPGSRWEHLGGVAFNRGSVFCDVHTGELVPRFHDDDTDSEDEEDFDFDL